MFELYAANLLNDMRNSVGVKCHFQKSEKDEFEICITFKE